MTNITRFEIKKLHGNINFDLKFKDNKLILVGENGTGKSTVLKILYYVLSRQWRKLSDFTFESFSITFDKEKHTIKSKDLFRLNINSKKIRYLPPPIRRSIVEMENKNDIIDFRKIEWLCEKFQLNSRRIMNNLQSEDEDYPYSHETSFSDNDCDTDKSQKRSSYLTKKKIKEALLNTKDI